MTLDLDAIKARCEAATEGPWLAFAAADGDERYFICGQPNGEHVCPDVCTLTDDTDAEFIANAITDVPALIAEVERLRERLVITDEMVERGRKARERLVITDEMVERGRKARESHYLRVVPVSCTCGWKSDTYIEADGLPRFEAHLVELALEAAAPLIAAQALRDFAALGGER